MPAVLAVVVAAMAVVPKATRKDRGSRVVVDSRYWKHRRNHMLSAKVDTEMVCGTYWLEGGAVR
jgi:hypothetical protein